MTRAWSWILIQSVEKMAKILILMYLSHLVRSEGMKIWTFWPKWAESVSARRQSVEHFVLPPPETIGGARDSLKGFLRSSHLSYFLLYLEACTFSEYISPFLSFENWTLQGVWTGFYTRPKWVFLRQSSGFDLNVKYPANCGIWSLSRFIFAITRYQEFFDIFFFYMIPLFLICY